MYYLNMLGVKALSEIAGKIRCLLEKETSKKAGAWVILCNQALQTDRL